MAHAARLPKNLVHAVQRVHCAGIRGLTFKFRGFAGVVAEDNFFFSPGQKIIILLHAYILHTGHILFNMYNLPEIIYCSICHQRLL